MLRPLVYSARSSYGWGVLVLISVQFHDVRVGLSVLAYAAFLAAMGSRRTSACP